VESRLETQRYRLPALQRCKKIKSDLKKMEKEGMSDFTKIEKMGCPISKDTRMGFERCTGHVMSCNVV